MCTHVHMLALWMYNIIFTELRSAVCIGIEHNISKPTRYSYLPYASDMYSPKVDLQAWVSS